MYLYINISKTTNMEELGLTVALFNPYKYQKQNKTKKQPEFLRLKELKNQVPVLVDFELKETVHPEKVMKMYLRGSSSRDLPKWSTTSPFPVPPIHQTTKRF